jgi:hypothetical protein
MSGAKRLVKIIQVVDNSYLSVHVNPENNKAYLKFDKLPENKNLAYFYLMDVVGHENNVRIKNVEKNVFARLDRNNHNFIMVDDALGETDDSLFMIRHDAQTNQKALYCVGNDKYCDSFTLSPAQDCLNAKSSTVGEAAKLDVIDI